MGAKRRLLEFLEFKGVKKAEFYKQTGLSNGFLDKNNNISSDNIAIIISNYNDINLNWLITGEGEMFRKMNEPKSMEDSSSLPNDHKTIMQQNSEIIKQNSEIIRQNAILFEMVAKIIDGNR